MVPPLSHPHVSSDCLKSFESARKAPPHQQSDDIILASRILRGLLYADGRTWQILESSGRITQSDIKTLHDKCRLFLHRGTPHDTPVYGALIKDLHNGFAAAEEVLQERRDIYNDISEPGLFAAQTGRHYTSSLISAKNRTQGNVVKMDTANPFLMLHVAAEVLHDIDRDIADHRDLFWEEKTDLFRRMHGYCHDLHTLVPVSLQTQEATTEQFQDAMQALTDLHDMIVTSQYTKMYIAVMSEQKQHLNILHNYIAPFGTEKKGPTAIAPEATLLEWDIWGPMARAAQERRAERRASMPKSYFSDMNPFMR